MEPRVALEIYSRDELIARGRQLGIPRIMQAMPKQHKKTQQILSLHARWVQFTEGFAQAAKAGKPSGV